MRLIDVDAFIAELKEVDMPYGYVAVEKIATAPTIDPVRHGEWKETDDPWFSACSVCGYLEYECNEGNYCPECGAKMEEQGV